MTERLASRRFTPGDQEQFAALTGDFNPIHLDPIAARRTQAGAPVVHGVHTLLWCLDTAAIRHPDMPAVASIKVRFDKLVYLDDEVEAVLVRHDALGFRMEAHVQGTVALRLAATFGLPCAAPDPETAGQPVLRPTRPIELSLQEIEGRSGRVGFATLPSDVARIFPVAARHLGARRIAALGCLTYLVGMVCPGLHSIFGGLSLKLVEHPGDVDAVGFRVTSTDSRFRSVRLAVSGGGIVGTVESFARPPPVLQGATAELARLVLPGEFAGTEALVVGGSRGLGEVTAKLLAVGGASVTLTYATGQAEAKRIRDEIRDWGAACDILQYDAGHPPAEQLRLWELLPTHLYYFATPPIFQQTSRLYSPDRFRKFLDFYVDAFHALCHCLIQRSSGELAAFYPSSIAVESRPPGMTEYAMAKMAGELLCSDMNAQCPRIHIAVSRIPRVRTDQTARQACRCRCQRSMLCPCRG